MAACTQQGEAPIILLVPGDDESMPPDGDFDDIGDDQPVFGPDPDFVAPSVQECPTRVNGPTNGGTHQSLQGAVVNFADSLAQGGAAAGLSVFPTGRLVHTQHDGYRTSINPSFAGPGFQYDEATFLAAGGIDITKWAGLGPDRTWKVGAFIGYNAIDLDVGSTRAVSRSLGVRRNGHGENDSFIAGAYSLMTYRHFYSLSVISGNWGETDIKNNLLDSRGDYDTDGIATVSYIGGVFPLGGMLKFNARASYGYSELEGDSYRDSVGFLTGRSEVEEHWGGLSGTLFAELPRGNGVLKPFVKVGVKHRFDYDNEVFIPRQTAGGVTFDSVRVRFDDDDTSINVEGGAQYAVGKWEYEASVFYDGSGDYDTVGGRIGAKISLN